MNQQAGGRIQKRYAPGESAGFYPIQALMRYNIRPPAYHRFPYGAQSRESID